MIIETNAIKVVRKMVVDTIDDLKPRIHNIATCSIEGACSREEAVNAIDLVINQVNSNLSRFPDLHKELNDMLEFCLKERSRANICS